MPIALSFEQKLKLRTRNLKMDQILRLKKNIFRSILNRVTAESQKDLQQTKSISKLYRETLDKNWTFKNKEINCSVVSYNLYLLYIFDMLMFINNIWYLL